MEGLGSSHLGGSLKPAFMQQRVVQQELLETYPDDHPDAIHSREDLLLVNAIMGNHHWMQRQLRFHLRPGWKITEIGAGDGALSRRFLALGLCHASALHAMDLAGRPSHWPKESHWTQGDLLRAPWPASEVLVANLILHHFDDPLLRELGQQIPSNTRIILAAEPHRHWVHTVMGRFFCWLAELHPITRYDMQVSIRAGFRGDELAYALGLQEKEWQWESHATLFGGYRFIAQRKDANELPNL